MSRARRIELPTSIYFSATRPPSVDTRYIAEALISAALTHLDLNGLSFDKAEMERHFACLLLANSSITKLELV
jgi:hypothetical protein